MVISKCASRLDKNELEEEAQAIEAAKEDPSRFGPLYDRYYKQIFIFVYRRVSDQEVTADITSQVFLKALINLKGYTFQGYPLSSWLYRIALNETNMYFRQQKKMVSVSISERELGAVMEESGVEEKERSLELMVDALNDLDEDQSQLVELRFFEKTSFAEIGEIFGITEANAKMKVYRILKKLKKMIKGH